MQLLNSVRSEMLLKHENCNNQKCCIKSHLTSQYKKKFYLRVFFYFSFLFSIFSTKRSSVKLKNARSNDFKAAKIHNCEVGLPDKKEWGHSLLVWQLRVPLCQSLTYFPIWRLVVSFIFTWFWIRERAYVVSLGAIMWNVWERRQNAPQPSLHQRNKQVHRLSCTHP